MAVSEVGYKQKLREILDAEGLWSESYEPGFGSGVGYPDLQVLVWGRLVPLELKRGWVRDGRVFCTRIKPSQISWHHRFLMAGGNSKVLICFGPKRDMTVVAAPGLHRDVLSRWKEGWELSNCEVWVDKGRLVINQAQILRSTFQVEE